LVSSVKCLLENRHEIGARFPCKEDVSSLDVWELKGAVLTCNCLPNVLQQRLNLDAMAFRASSWDLEVLLCYFYSLTHWSPPPFMKPCNNIFTSPLHILRGSWLFHGNLPNPG
jgi:hypothetical protein